MLKTKALTLNTVKIMNKHLLLNIAFRFGPAFTISNALADVPLTPAQFAKAKLKILKKVLLSNLNKPHALVWGPDNQIWLTELVTGKILRVNPETGAVKTVFQVPGIINDPHAQNGLLGFAFHPDFKITHIFISLELLKSSGNRQELSKSDNY